MLETRAIQVIKWMFLKNICIKVHFLKYSFKYLFQMQTNSVHVYSFASNSIFIL